MRHGAGLQVAVVSEDPTSAWMSRSLSATCARFRVGLVEPSELTDAVQLIVVSPRSYESVLAQVERLGAAPSIVTIAEHQDAAGLAAALEDRRLLAGLSRGATPYWNPDHLTYAARRALMRNEPAPPGAALLSWGATTAMWRTASTSEMRQVLEGIEEVGRRAGLTRRELADVSWVGHELMMNALYDAPTDRAGRFLHAADRTQDVQLDPSQAATVRFSVAATGIAIDVRDPFGSLTRERFLGGIRRTFATGQAGSSTLDTSHGGAGLGIAGCFSRASLLRGEVVPGASSLVSWVRSRLPERQVEAALAPSWVFVSRPLEPG